VVVSDSNKASEARKESVGVWSSRQVRDVWSFTVTTEQGKISYACTLVNDSGPDSHPRRRVADRKDSRRSARAVGRSDT
jgi:hypothetical protein